MVVGAVVGEGLATNGDSYIETANGRVVSGNSPDPATGRKAAHLLVTAVVWRQWVCK